MSESPSEMNPQILVNGEEEEKQKDDAAAEAEVQISSEDPGDECVEESAAAERETHAKVQFVFQQVRNQIRSQVGAKASKNSIMELVQKVIDRESEIAQLNCKPEGCSEEKKQAETLTDENKDEVDRNEEDLRAIFEKKLEESQKALKDEFEVQISQVRKEMQAYTDQALKDLECKMQSLQSQNLQDFKEQLESKEQDKRQKPSGALSLAARRGRLLTRTMTTIIPKTCAPVIIGPRAKSETLSSKAEGSRFQLRDPLHSVPGSRQRQSQSRNPLPPACPPYQQRKKPAQPKAKAGN